MWIVNRVEGSVKRASGNFSVDTTRQSFYNAANFIPINANSVKAGDAKLRAYDPFRVLVAELPKKTYRITGPLWATKRILFFISRYATLDLPVRSMYHANVNDSLD